MKIKCVIASVIGTAVLGIQGQALSQTKVVSVATQNSGIAPVIANALAKVVSKSSGLQLRARSIGATTQFAPMVNGGQMEFGLSNTYQGVFAYQGASIFEGRPNPNLRMVLPVFPFTVGIAVRNDSPIKSIGDLRGKRVPWGFTSQKTGQLTWDSVLANAGITATDIKPVPVSSFQTMWTQFKQGKLDVTNIVINGSTAQEIDAAVGGVRFINWNDSPQSVKAMTDILPGTILDDIKVRGKGYSVKAQLYYFDMWSSTAVPDEVVYQITKSVYEGASQLRKISPLWRGFHPEKMAASRPYPHHPGAIKFYKEVGIWPKG